MALVEILNVSLSDLNSSLLWGRYVDAPKAGDQTEVYSIDIKGWVLGRSSPAVAVELVHEGAVVQRVPLNTRRPDIAAAFTKVPEAENSGFRTSLSVVGMKPNLILFLRAVLHDESRVPIGVIRAQVQSPQRNFQPRLQPLMLTTYGRTGSTWVTRLLGENPQVITYRPFRHEPRVGSYWMRILKTLSEPTSYLQPITVTDASNEYWWLGEKASPPELVNPDLEIQQWLGQDCVEAFVTFCQDRIDKFYTQVAAVQGRSEAIYFAEKYSPSNFDRVMMWELYPCAREIILVRDFRDMICSILAYNSRRGYEAFGRESVDNDKAFVWKIRLYALNLLRNYKNQSKRAHLLRYEDLILHPTETLTALLEYLDLDSTPTTVEGMLQRASEETPGMQQHRTSTDPRRSIGRWRVDLDATLQAACQEAFGDVLEEFGYTE